MIFFPVGLSAQEVSRLIDMPDVIDDNAKRSMTKVLQDAFSSVGNIVFNQEEMQAAAKDVGVRDHYWDEAALIAKVNKKLRHDALIVFQHQLVKRKSSLIIFVYNAYTGELMAEFERPLKKRRVISKADTKALTQGIMPVLAEIDPSLYPPNIVVKITSTPPGAEVVRAGQVIGVTPFESEFEQRMSGVVESWTVRPLGGEGVVQEILMSASGSYDVVLPEKKSSHSTSSNIGKLASGFGRPIFLIGMNISPSIRRLSSSAKDGASLNYRSSVYPMISFDLEFYPSALFSQNDYLQGLGIELGFGYGPLKSPLSLGTSPATDNQCDVLEDGSVSCKTNHMRFNFNLIYKLLLQKRDGKLNPFGMAIDFMAGFNMSHFKLDRNPVYTGHIYTGIDVGSRFSTPLGLDALRLALDLRFHINLDNGDLYTISRWGSSVKSSWGIRSGLGLTYDVWRGIYLRAGYQFSYFADSYRGAGCLDALCSSPLDANTKDYYHEIILGFGYAMY